MRKNKNKNCSIVCVCAMQVRSATRVYGVLLRIAYVSIYLNTVFKY